MGAGRNEWNSSAFFFIAHFLSLLRERMIGEQGRQEGVGIGGKYLDKY